MSAEYNAQLTELTAEVASFRRTSDEVNAYVRKLEQKNDDLERTNRYAVCVCGSSSFFVSISNSLRHISHYYYCIQHISHG